MKTDKTTTNKPTHTPLTSEEKRQIYGCDYCVGIGACHKCLGRAGYDRLQKELNVMISRANVDAISWRRDDAIRADLLAACKAHMKSVDALKLDGYDDMRAAIAKAEGR